MEQLTKQQITLLCLLVALFTSIATSVITASLVDQTSGSVSQTIYKVVEKTIDEVASKDSPVRKIIEKDKPAQNPSDKQIPIETIASNADQSLAGIWSRTGRESGTYISTAVVLGNKNTVLAFNGLNIFENVTYVLRLKDGKEYEMRKVRSFENMALLQPVSGDVKLDGLSLDTLYSENLGSNIIAVGAKEQNNVVSTGIITEFPMDGNDTPSENRDDAITDIKLSLGSSGWVLLSTNGRIVGFLQSTSEGDKGARYFDAGIISKAFSELF